MKIYAGAIAVRRKADRSPVSDADVEAEAIILEGLARILPGVDVLAEERVAREGAAPMGAAFLAVDPLDGTREFLQRRDEFTVNIALIEAGRPVAGCVYAPALHEMFLGGVGAWMARIAPGATLAGEALAPIRTRPYPALGLTAVASRSHQDPETAAFLARLNVRETMRYGSSLKLARIAQGGADVYPRFGATMEWDTAAGHGVLAAAGGTLLTPEGAPFFYGKAADGYRNGPFVAWGGQPLWTSANGPEHSADR